MARNTSTVTVYDAEFKGLMFAAGSAAWTVTRFESQTYEPRAVSTLARELVGEGWRELGAYDLTRSFPRGKCFGDAPVERAFVTSAPGSRMGRVVVLTAGKW